MHIHKTENVFIFKFLQFTLSFLFFRTTFSDCDGSSDVLSLPGNSSDADPFSSLPSPVCDIYINLNDTVVITIFNNINYRTQPHYMILFLH